MKKKDGPITDVGKKFAGARKDNPSQTSQAT